MSNSVGVYYSGQDFSLDAPAFFVDRETARQWLRQDAAWSIHHGRDIALTFDLEPYLGNKDGRQLTLGPQQSQIMGEIVMRANAEREEWAVRMTRGWSPHFALAAHQLSLRRYRKLSKVSVSGTGKVPSGCQQNHTHAAACPGPE